MKKILMALILIIPFFAFGADTLVWNSSGDNDMNDPANYYDSTAHGAASSIDADDVIFWTNKSVVPCTSSATLSIHAARMTSGYTGSWNLLNYGLQCSGPFINDGDNAQKYGGNLKFTGTAWDTIHLGTTIDTIMATTCTLSIDGKYFVDADKAYPRFYNIVVVPDASDSIKLIGATPGIVYTNQIIVGSGYIDLNNQDFQSYITTQTTPLVYTGNQPYITVTGASEHSMRFNFYNTSKLTATFPKIVLTGVKAKFATNAIGSDSLEVQQTDSVICGISEITNNSSGKPFVYRTMGKYLKQTADWRVGTNAGANVTTRLYLSQSSVVCRGINFAYTSSSGVSIYWDSATVINDATISAIGPLGTSNAGISTFTMTNTGGGIINCNGLALGSVVFNTGVNRSLSSSFNCLSFTQSAGAGFNQNGKLITVNGDLSITGGSASTMNAKSILYGNVTFGASANVTTTSCTLSVASADKSIAINRTQTINKIDTATSLSIVNLTGSGNLTITNGITAGDVTINRTGALILGPSAISDLTHTGGKITINSGDTIRCVDFTSNATGAGDSIINNGTIIINGHYSQANAVKWGGTGQVLFSAGSHNVTANSGLLPKIGSLTPCTIAFQDSARVTQYVPADSTTTIFKSGAGWSVTTWDTASANGIAGKVNRYSGSVVGSNPARLYTNGKKMLSYTYWRDVCTPVDTIDAAWSRGNRSGGGNKCP